MSVSSINENIAWLVKRGYTLRIEHNKMYDMYMVGNGHYVEYDESLDNCLQAIVNYTKDFDKKLKEEGVI